MRKARVALSALAVVCSGCSGLFHMNLATKKDPPKAIEYSEVTISATHSAKTDRVYWFDVPAWHERVASSPQAAADWGGWKALDTTKDVVVWLQKDDRDLLQTSCFWQPASLVLKAKRMDSDYSTSADIVASSTGDRFTMDCDFFDKANDVSVH